MVVCPLCGKSLDSFGRVVIILEQGYLEYCHSCYYEHFSKDLPEGFFTSSRRELPPRVADLRRTRVSSISSDSAEEVHISEDQNEKECKAT